MMGAVDSLIAEFGIWALAGAAVVMLIGGFTKGALGFALPMIAISGIGSLMTAELAVAGLILPALATNIWQSLRNGPGEAVASLQKFWRLNIVLMVMIYLCAQLVTIISATTLYLVLGTGVTLFASLQITGFRPRFPLRLKNRVEVGVGLVSGFFGGLSGVWGPPILLYLMALDTPKTEQVRVQGISFMVGSVVLTVAHRQSGLLGATSTPFSALLVIPALIGMTAGYLLHHRMDQVLFRKATLIVLVLAGLNLLRRGFFG